MIKFDEDLPEEKFFELLETKNLGLRQPQKQALFQRINSNGKSLKKASQDILIPGEVYLKDIEQIGNIVSWKFHFEIQASVSLDTV